MKTILVPTDFSNYADYALEYAAAIAKKKGIKLYIMHVILHKKDLPTVHAKLSKVTKQSFLMDVDYVVKLEEGNSVSRVINKEGIALDVDLIIMGSNGASNLGEMILGSNTENVIRHSHCNVLTIKHKMFDIKFDTILFPSDFSKESHTVFKQVKAFADLFSAKIHLLKVNTPQHHKAEDKIFKKMDDLIAAVGMENDSERLVKKVYTADFEESGILNYCIEIDADIILIGSHGKSVLRKLVKASTSHNLVRDCFRPILTVRF